MERTMDDREPAERDFSPGERLLVRTFRLLALGSACHRLRPYFAFTLGYAGEEAYRAVLVFVQQLSLAGRRRIVLSAPPARGVTADEVTILAAFAAAQADDYRTLDACLEALIAAPPPASLGGAVCLVARVFEMQGLALAVRGQDDAHQHRRPVRGCGGYDMAVPDRPGEFQALVHIEDHAGRIEHPAGHQQ
jgi:hypothetical protein